MKFTCEKSILLNGITIASRTVSVKNGIPAMEGIFVRAGADLEMTGYNLETGISVSVEAEILEEGTCVFPTRLFSDIIRKMPDEPIEVKVDGNYKAEIRCGMSRFNIMVMSAEEYPELPEVDSEKAIAIPQRELKSLISGTIFSISDNQTRPIQTGCLFEVENDSVTVVAVDGYRFARRCYRPEQSLERSVKFVAPGAALKELEKILADTDDEASFTLGTKHLMFKIGSVTLICRLLEGEFMDWRRVVPTSCPVLLVANVASMVASIERVSLIVSEKVNTPLRCRLEDNFAEFKTVSSIGMANDSCSLAGDGKGIEIGFNCRYILEALRAVPTPEAQLNLNNSLSPMVITPADGSDSFSYMVLPVRLKAGE